MEAATTQTVSVAMQICSNDSTYNKQCNQAMTVSASRYLQIGLQKFSEVKKCAVWSLIPPSGTNERQRIRDI